MSAVEGSEGVLTCGTFSKTVAPGLRVGWVLGHEALVQRCDLLRFDNGISTVLLAGLAVFVSEGLWDAQIDKVQTLYRRKMLAFTGALREHCADFLSFEVKFDAQGADHLAPANRPALGAAGEQHK